MIPLYKPYICGAELKNIQQLLQKSNSPFTKDYFINKCIHFFQTHYSFPEVYLTPSCTDALEMSALLLNILPGDEVIVPSYTLSATANAFALRGANIVFADSKTNTPNISPESICAHITPRTKAVVVVHYAGIACDIEEIKQICTRNSLYLIEDAAHAIDSFYDNKPLGTFGDLSAFSFHKTKNIISGEGGMIVINDPQLSEPAAQIRAMGTDKAQFAKGEVDFYTWQRLGSSYILSELSAAFLYGQLNVQDKIQKKRKNLWEKYYKELKEVKQIKLPFLPVKATANGHIFYIQCRNNKERNGLIDYLNQNKIQAAFHYTPLHTTPFATQQWNIQKLPNARHWGDTIVRLPLYFELQPEEVAYICNNIKKYYAL